MGQLVSLPLRTTLLPFTCTSPRIEFSHAPCRFLRISSKESDLGRAGVSAPAATVACGRAAPAAARSPPGWWTARGSPDWDSAMDDPAAVEPVGCAPKDDVGVVAAVDGLMRYRAGSRGITVRLNLAEHAAPVSSGKVSVPVRPRSCPERSLPPVAAVGASPGRRGVAELSSKSLGDGCDGRNVASISANSFPQPMISTKRLTESSQSPPT
mmetsp:Transcript_8906/g.19033  ORF Transcript_8906/g.19033 Transcript_8906/m.19033 type:complete len:211 (-) Transcript_8906:572-1204(-)